MFKKIQTFVVQNLMILGILLPIIVLGISLSFVYLPFIWTEKPKYDFIYSGRSFDCHTVYISKNKLKIEKKSYASTDYCAKNEQNPDQLKFYYHDVTRNSSRNISLEELANMNFDNNGISADGYALKKQQNERVSVLLFSTYSSENGIYLQKNSVSYKQNILTEVYEYSFNFIAWKI